MTGRPVRRARWKPSSADLPETHIKLLPPDEQAPEISQGFAHPAGSYSSASPVQEAQLFLIFDLFVAYLWRPSWDYSSPNARSKSARAFQNASKPCRYWSSALASEDCCCKRSLNTIVWCE